MVVQSMDKQTFKKALKKDEQITDNANQQQLNAMNLKSMLNK